MPTQLNRVALQASLGFFALVTLIFTLAGWMLFDLCARIDEQQRHHSEADAQRALETRLDKLGRVLTDYSFWLEAYARTSKKVDVNWAYEEDNVGPSLYSGYGVNGAFILAPTGVTRYAVVGGGRSKLQLDTWLGDDQARLLAQARERSLKDGYAQGYFLIEGKPASVLAAVIRPDATYQDFKRLSYMVFVDILTPDKLAQLGQTFELPGLTAEPGELPALAERPTLVVKSDPGIVVTFHWLVHGMGQRLLAQFLPLLATMCGLALLLVWYLRRRIGLAARQTNVAEDALRHSEQRFRTVSEASSDWIWESDAEQRLVYLSERFVAVTGFSREDWLGRPLHELLGYPPSQVEEVARTPLATGRTRRPLRCEMRDAQAKLRYCQLTAQPIISGGLLAGFRGTVCDVTEEIEAKARIEHISQHDALTGLANRHQLHRYLAQRFAAGVNASQPLHLLALDLDRFKPVNDSLGHGAGDQVLCQVARELRASVREGDLVARIGGDEFVIAVNGCLSAEQVSVLCNRMLEGIGRPMRIDEHDINIGASIGIARAPQDGHGAEDLLRYADIALYEAKAAGRNTLRFYEPTMNQRILERRQLETELRLGLQRLEFELDFQPRFAANGQRLLGAEALVRWNHPARGRLAPAAFIGVAEETGLILGLSDWVLQEACSQALEWAPELIVSINLSPLEFQRDDLVARIRKVLDRTGIDPARVELELTENVLLDDAAGALELMKKLKALGVRLSMDDFGTGYSSLSYLRTYPFDCLKIDRSFVSNIEVSESNAAIVEAIVSMGRALSLTVVAEGIETAGQLARIADLKCDQAQGFHLQRPLSPARFAALRQEQSQPREASNDASRTLVAH
ncbi:diguanylate cyclase (GGDEF)-like protein/PAS domain S-box-containing protein [Pseudomonas sp. SORGH_AS 211]|uniref:bifunctional diguanylate cyclase/phosphodiesterase n=1 Tax=Pseudomonas sp. SORGH_AS_0211 TaxID=3041796 RepID=UPI0028636260|nr:EAL domain-containing protein [Pseudomonas sp. SORGH_AS_0211]MDR6178852.1 diguanylate cyclase (GGDEF)-like protein/PAS domain S-box-containing protein [Pseudomonas sp. SORGH_AS_0211]